MIVEYSSFYEDDVKKLFVELQEHIVKIDYEKYNIISDNYGEVYLEKTLEEINKYKGKMFLLIKDAVAVGLVVGFINNDESNDYDFKVPRRGRVTELVVSSAYRNNGYGKILLNAMEDYLKSVGCVDVLIGVFAYNQSAINFYEDNGYHLRMVEVTKKI